MHIHSYSSVYAAGHRATTGILDGPVTVQEKIDGSQFTMQRVGGELFCRSKGKDLVIDYPEKLFIKAIETAKRLDLRDGWIYRCEYVSKLKHNVLEYKTTPPGYLIVYDIDTGDQAYMDMFDLLQESARVGLVHVPTYAENVVIKSYDELKKYLSRESILGGNIEGVVIKNYAMYGPDKKILMAKIVRDEFKEVHATEWKKANPTQSDILQALISTYRTEARWEKAFQHLRDAGQIEREGRDIPKIMREVHEDIKKECEDEIKKILFAHFWDKLKRGSIAGLPEWYKKKLMELAQ